MKNIKKGWKNNHSTQQWSVLKNIGNTNLTKTVIQLYWEDKKEKAKWQQNKELAKYFMIIT